MDDSLEILEQCRDITIINNIIIFGICLGGENLFGGAKSQSARGHSKSIITQKSCFFGFRGLHDVD